MENLQIDRIQEMLGDKYRILQSIGKGGMGNVFMVEKISNGKLYAAKVVNNDELGNGKEEAQILCMLKHHMLPEINEYFVCGTYVAIIMEYIAGQNMEEYIKEKGPVNQKVLVDCFRQLLDILYYLHNQKPPLIYRDLKPSNIMVEKKGKLRLIDFGTARFYKNGINTDTMALGTPGYAAPEQLMGSVQSDVRTDIYSLGATMYYIATGIDIGKPPFEAARINTVRTGISDYLDVIIQRCLQKNPQSRYQNVLEIIRELDQEEFSEKDLKDYNIINICITHSNKNI